MSETRVGSSKEMSAVSPGKIEVFFTDGWSAYDRGRSPQLIRGLGAARCACAVRSFEHAERAGYKTHFIRQVSETSIHVQEFEVPGKPSLSGVTFGRVIPLEVLWRIRVAWTLVERIQAGKVTPESLGFRKGQHVVEGMLLPHMLVECTTKFEPIDRHVSAKEAKVLAGLTDEQYDRALQLVRNCAMLLDREFDLVSFGLFDGKKELAITPDGEIVLIDAFGTQDENRIMGLDGPHDKDLLRLELIRLGWKAELDAAKAKHPDDKSKWPPYPILNRHFLDGVAERYNRVARRYADADL